MSSLPGVLCLALVFIGALVYLIFATNTGVAISWVIEGDDIFGEAAKKILKDAQRVLQEPRWSLQDFLQILHFLFVIVPSIKLSIAFVISLAFMGWCYF